jgi:hypothetical protein
VEGTFDTQEQALGVAHELTRAFRLTELFVHGRDGQIVDRSTYPRSSDPAESPG